MTASNGLGSTFAVSVEFAPTQVVLGVRGELDRLTAPALRNIAVAVVDSGHRRVVLDLAECDFIDASGLRVIAEFAEHLDVWGGVLAVRSPSRVVRHLLDITGLDDLTALVQTGVVPPHVGPGRRADRPKRAVPTRPSVPASHLTRVAAIPADHDVVDAALRLVVALARATVGGADGVSVSLRRHGQLATVAASDRTISDMDTAQYATGEGPCIDASVEGQRFHAESLQSDTRWPAFTPRALRLGINSILSSPLVVRDRTIGALNIYSRTPGAFAADDQRLASVFATEASTVLAGAGADVTSDQLAARLAQTLATRQVIAIAQGVLMERSNIDEDAAYRALRRFAVRTGRPLLERAEDVVASTRSTVAAPSENPGARHE